MKTISKSKVIAAAATGGFVLALGFGILQYDKSSSAIKQLHESKLLGEKSLSEKLQIKKLYDQKQVELSGVNSKNESLKKDLLKEKSQVRESEQKVQSLTKDNGRVKNLEKQLNDSKKKKTELEQQLAALRTQMEGLEKTNNALSLETKKAKDEAKTAKDNLALSAALASNFRAEAHKGKKSKLTVSAKRTKKMVVGFDIPQSMGQNVKFKLKTPSGKKYDSGSNELKAEEVKSTELVFASLGNPEMEVSKRIELTFKPSEKLESGIYQIEVVNGETKVGSCQIALR